MKKTGLLTLFLCFTVWLSAFAQERGFSPMQDVDSFKKGLEAVATSTKTIKASFQQEKYLAILSDKIQSEGLIRFKQPGFLRWEYNEPFEYSIVLNGKEVIVKDQGKSNTMDLSGSKSFKEINELIVNSIQGNVLDDEKFDIEFLQSEDFYLTKLVPKEAQMAKFVAGINVYFDKKDYAVSKVKLKEDGGDYTLISFFDKKMNEAIADEVFSNQ
ncbi:outer membrane lipoprotein carrier protein LolA [Cytophagaceae bacterium ABcell3]|nr:outer membrane lipoprotein carrier protein LolA [Cytophagaceae bacterium ABcell3]